MSRPVSVPDEIARATTNQTNINSMYNMTGGLYELDCDDSTPIDQHGYIQFITLGCILFVIAVVGILTNCLSIIIFSRMPQKSSTTFLIQMLAIADSAFLFFNILNWSVIGWYNALGKICYYFKHFTSLIPYINGLLEISRDLAVWMVAVVSAERYVAIYYPLSMTKVCRVSVATRVLTVLFLYVIAFNVPTFLQYQYGEFTGNESDSLPSYSYGNWLTLTFTYSLTYYTIDAIANLLIPMLMVLTMNFRIILVLRRARTQRATLSRNADTDRGAYATVMLVFIACIFVVCSTPKVFESIYIIWETVQSNRSSDTFALTITSTLLQAINSFINFFIYCLTARRVRIILKEMFSCWKCRERIYVCSMGKYDDETDF